MKKPMELRRDDLEDLIDKQVVVTHKKEQFDTDLQILQGTLKGYVFGNKSATLPTELHIRNDSEELIKIRVPFIQDIRVAE